MARPITITNYGLVQSSAEKKWGSYSIYMESNSNLDAEYAVTAATTDLNLGSGDWTIEFWARPNSSVTESIVLSARNNDNRQWRVQVTPGGSGSGELAFRHNNLPPNPEHTVSGTINANTWYHFAVVKYNNQVKCYIDGVGGTATSNTLDYGAINNVWAVYIGFYVVGDGVRNSFDGYVDNIRISNTARYTGNFTPPSGQLTSDSNTLWLPNDENTGSFLSDNVPVTHSGQANLTASFTQTASAIQTHAGRAGLTATFTQDSRAGVAFFVSDIVEDYTWDTVSGDVWTGFPKDNWIWQGIHLPTSFGLTSSGGFVTPGAADLSSSFAVSAQGGYLQSGASDLNNTFVLSASGERLVVAASDLQSNFTVNAQSQITRGGAASLNTQAQLDSRGGVILPVSADLAVDTQVNARGRLIYDVEILLDNWATLQAQPSLFVGGATNLASDTDLSASATALRGAQADLQSQFGINVGSDLFRPGSSDLFIDSDLAVNGEVIRGGQSNLALEFELRARALDIGRTALSLTTELTANASIIRGGVANLVMAGFLVSVGIRAHGGSANLAINSTLTARARATFGGRADLVMTGFVLGAGESRPSIKGTVLLPMTLTVSAEGEFVLFDSDFIISVLPETRQFDVKSEIRDYQVLPETRRFDLDNGETRTFEVLPETRTLEVV